MSLTPTRRPAQTLFVTATDTDAGKTTVSCALLRALADRGVRACGFKPVASGAIDTPQGPASADALALQAASSSAATLGEINPLLFGPAIAPHLAAAAAGQRIDPAALAAAHAVLTARHDIVVAEGAGGWLVPLADDLLLGDWVAARGWPVLLVVRVQLGCLNHALLTAEAIAARGARLAGWVANLAPPVPDEAQALIATLSQRLGAPLWQQTDAPSAPQTALDALSATLFRHGENPAPPLD